MGKHKKFGKPSHLPDDFDSSIHRAGTVTQLVPSKNTGRCYESHPPLKIGEYVIYGGSCINPTVKDADIYIGFDSGMQTKTQFPWNENSTQHVYFHITDMSVPQDIVEFNKMLDWIELNLKAGKKIHMGCIGGHGRTGTVFAALVAHMTGNMDAITYVREKYCKKAVESARQIDFLHEHFGVTKVAASKGGFLWEGNASSAVKPRGESGSSWAHQKTSDLFSSRPSRSTVAPIKSNPKPATPYNKERINAGVHKELHDVTPVKSKASIWG